MLSQCHAWEPCCEHWSIVVEAVLAIMSLAIWLYVITTYRFCACTCNMMYSFHYYVDLASWVAWPLASPPQIRPCFCLLHLHSTPGSLSEYWFGYPAVKNFEDMFTRFDRIHERDRRTHTHTQAVSENAWRHGPRLHSITRQKPSNQLVQRCHLATDGTPCHQKMHFYRAMPTRMHIADYAVARCLFLSVRLSTPLSVTRRY